MQCEEGALDDEEDVGDGSAECSRQGLRNDSATAKGLPAPSRSAAKTANASKCALELFVGHGDVSVACGVLENARVSV